MRIDRRNLFALAGLGAIGIGTGELGPEVDPNYGAGITIRVRREWTEKGMEWAVLVPDFEHHWVPGRTLPPVKWMPLTEWFDAVQKLADAT